MFADLLVAISVSATACDPVHISSILHYALTNAPNCAAMH